MTVNLKRLREKWGKKREEDGLSERERERRAVKEMK